MKTYQNECSKISKEEFNKAFRETFCNGSATLDDSNSNESLYLIQNQSLIDQLKARRAKKFGKVASIEVKKENPNDNIISFIKSKKSIDLDQLITTFSIYPTDFEKNLVISFISRNQMANIRKRKQDYLLRMVIHNKKLYKKFKSLEKAKKVRNVLFFYLITKESKFGCLAKRNILSSIKRKLDYRNKQEKAKENKENEISESEKNDNINGDSCQQNGLNIVFN